MARGGWFGDSYRHHLAGRGISTGRYYARRFRDRIPGGLAAGRRPSEFSPAALKQGVKVELEHTSDPLVAREIAMDHLAEDPLYYRRLEAIERPRVGKVDLRRYSGRWVQESVSPEPWFQRGCKRVTAEYVPQADGSLVVKNSCDGRVVEGVARSVSKDNRQLSVSFGPFVRGSYEIVDVDPSYRKAVVRGGDGTVWVLRRGLDGKYLKRKDLSREELVRWRENVNMSPGELEKFMREYGGEAGLSRVQARAQGVRSGRDSARAIIRMKRKPVAEWSAGDVAWLRRQNSFVSRMRGVRGPLYGVDGRPTRKLLALKVWGHDPEEVTR